MNRRMIRFVHCFGMPLVFGALITSAFAQPSPPSTFRHQIKPGKIAEECRVLEAGARVAYRYTASAPVPFNVHFHKGNTVAYPVKIESSAGEDATFTAPSSEDYCWMWANTGSSDVTVEGSLAARP